MKNLRNYYGATLLDDENTNNKIILEYYKNTKHTLSRAKLKTIYGITVIKKKYEDGEVKLEKKCIKNISPNEKKIRRIIELLKTYKVTPIALNDVLTDLLKTQEFQRN